MFNRVATLEDTHVAIYRSQPRSIDDAIVETWNSASLSLLSSRGFIWTRLQPSISAAYVFESSCACGAVVPLAFERKSLMRRCKISEENIDAFGKNRAHLHVRY